MTKPRRVVAQSEQDLLGRWARSVIIGIRIDLRPNVWMDKYVNDIGTHIVPNTVSNDPHENVRSYGGKYVISYIASK